MRKVLAIAVGALVLLAACSGGGGGSAVDDREQESERWVERVSAAPAFDVTYDTDLEESDSYGCYWRWVASGVMKALVAEFGAAAADEEEVREELGIVLNAVASDNNPCLVFGLSDVQ